MTLRDEDTDFWVHLARHSPLAILTDLDGTLIPYAPTPDEATVTEEIANLIERLSWLDATTVAVVSGRPRAALDGYFPRRGRTLLVAEHGAWRRGPGAWERMVSGDEGAVDSLAAGLRPIIQSYPGARIEQKTWSIAVHYRSVAPEGQTGLVVQAGALVDDWIAAHPSFELLAGACVLEVRPRSAHKGNAVGWVKGLAGQACRMFVVGDDVTDEDMFVAAGPEDATVFVGSEPDRPTAARWRFGSPDEACAFLEWIVSVRRETAAPRETREPSRVPTLPDAGRDARFDLLVLSNRLPELRSADDPAAARKRNVGGLVSALEPVLGRRKAIWLGWSGRTRPEATATELGWSSVGDLALAWVDFPDAWHRHYYSGLSNSLLWPLFHSFPTRMKIAHEDWHAYEAANEAFALLATRIVAPDATVWAHDYHLLLLGGRLRAHGHTGPIGLFQHIPFPCPDLFFLLPWARPLLEAMLDLDLIGFHTLGYVDNFLRCMAELPGVRVEGRRAIRGATSVLAGAFPLGIIPADFMESSQSDEVLGLMRSIHPSRLVLGVDRLDYTKGIPERLIAFGRFLELFPEWRRKVCLVQVSVPSRGDIPEYVEQRGRVENIVGRVNGEYGEADWIPIRYLYRSYGRGHLTELYRAADVGYVTPLRDGMNLVAKEYVAAQDPAKPGVLLLSRFAGAAEELTAALLTNPWDPDGMAHDLDRALSMPLDERLTRHRSLLDVISRTTALTWAEGFLSALKESRARGPR